MKFPNDSTVFDIEKGKCWQSKDSFIGYGTGYPEEVTAYDFEPLEEKPERFFFEYIVYSRMNGKYYQRRAKQTNFVSIMYLCEGEMYFRSDGQILLAEPGDCVLLKPHHQNDFLHLPGRKCSNFEIILDGSAIDRILHLYGLEHVLWTRIPDSRPFSEIFQRCGELNRRRSEKSIPRELAGLALEVIELISRAAGKQAPPPAVAQVKTELAKQLRKKVGMTEIARQCAMCLPVMNRRFRNAFGVTPYAYLKQLRLERGALLLEKGLRVKEVAGLVGYENPKSFSAEFHRFHGVSPLEYRLRVRPLPQSSRLPSGAD